MNSQWNKQERRGGRLILSTLNHSAGLNHSPTPAPLLAKPSKFRTYCWSWGQVAAGPMTSPLLVSSVK